MNHREALGVSQTASPQEIKQAFRNAAKEIHPDHNNSPEAVEAFIRIKRAQEALLKEAEAPRESSTVQSSAARAAAATAQATYSPPPPPPMTEEEIAHIQMLDELVRKSEKSKTIFRRAKESAELRKHRKKLKTNERRLRGLY